MLKFDHLQDVAGDDAELSKLLDSGQSQPDSLTPDPDPDYGRVSLEDRLFPDAGGKAAGTAASTVRRVTQAVRKDVRAKVTMLLMVAGTTWSTRDAHCGGALVDAIADSDEDERVGIATALSDLICDSPDLVNWFTSSGRYMKWLTLAMAVQPVLTVAFHHHISHQLGDADQAPDDWTAYATG